MLFFDSEIDFIIVLIMSCLAKHETTEKNKTIVIVHHDSYSIWKLLQGFHDIRLS
jgi:hypothetical protein